MGMTRLVVASMGPSAGKTMVIVGAAKALKAEVGYMKPFGERLVYLKKRLWDYDAALMTSVFGLKEYPEEMTIGFGQSKLRYMYDEATRQKKLVDMASHLGKDRPLLFIEGGAGLRHGGSVGLDPISVARTLQARLVIVTAGNEDSVMDDLTFLKKHIDLKGIDFGGVILNKVQSPEDFKESCLPGIKELGMNVLGMVPFEKELTHLSVRFLAEKLFARVIAGERGMDRLIKHVFVGSMSADPAHRNTLSNIINKENKLIITSGDRSDMILTALESDTSCIVLTNNVLPPSNLIAKAQDAGVPMLMVPQDTYSAATQIDDIEPLIMKQDTGKLALAEKLVLENIDLKKMTGA
jgi:BioD-like phosphotransacetylase family protein